MRRFTDRIVQLFIVFAFFLSCSGAGITVRTPAAPLTKEDIEAARKIELAMTELFTRAEQHIGRGQYTDALAVIQPVINDYPGTVYSDRAYFMKGAIYADVLNFNRDVEKAAAAFRMVIASEPVTDYDKRAQEMLDKIKK